MTKYDVILDHYTPVASMPAPRSNFASVLLNGQGYIIGGFESANTAARSIPNVRRSYRVPQRRGHGCCSSPC